MPTITVSQSQGCDFKANVVADDAHGTSMKLTTVSRPSYFNPTSLTFFSPSSLFLSFKYYNTFQKSSNCHLESHGQNSFLISSQTHTHTHTNLPHIKNTHSPYLSHFVLHLICLIQIIKTSTINYTRNERKIRKKKYSSSIG